MKYMLKRIIIGVVIGIVLMNIKTCEVNASAQYLSDGWNWAIVGKWDVCQKSGDDFLCTDGFEKSWGETSNSELLYGDGAGMWSDKYFFLKELSFSVQYGSGAVYLNSNFQLLNAMPFFYNHTKEGFQSIQLNQSWSYVKFTTRDDIVCEVSADTVGSVVRVNGSPISSHSFTPAVYVPQACRGKYLSKLEVMYTPYTTYNGPTNIYHNWDFNVLNLNEFLQKNQNNQYLDVWHGQEIKTSANFNNAQFYQNSQWYYSNYTFKPTSYSPANLEIQQNLSELNKQIIMSQMIVGSSEFTSDLDDDMTSSFGSAITSGIESADTFNFTDFFSAIITTPISMLTQSASSDFYDHTTYRATGSLCFGSYQQGGDNPGWIPIPFKNTGTFTQDNFKLPCMTTDIYSHIGGTHNGTGFGIMGASALASNDPTLISYEGSSFLQIWLLLQHFVLFYILVVSFLHLVKSLIDTNEIDIEVLDL